MKSDLSFWHERGWLRGILLAGALATGAMILAQQHWAQQWGLGALTLAILLGMVVGNSVFPAIATHTAAGIDFSRNRLLRLGIILYGFRLTFQQIAAVGWGAMAIDALVLLLTFALAQWLGRRLFRLDRETAILIGAGASICGAAAVLATEPVIKAPAHKVAVAVATVVVFGTLSMFIYPWLFPHLGLSQQAFGIYAGSTIHEVAQVVVAGGSIGPDAQASAVIVKMLRVMMLAPFLVVLSGWLRRSSAGAHDVVRGRKTAIVIPWFALLFIVASGVNSLGLLPRAVVKGVIALDNVLLAMAMAALGVQTHVQAIRQAGVRPLLLAFILFVFLLGGGYAINRGVLALTGMA